MTKKKNKRAKERPIFCGKCGRVTFPSSDEFQWWLVGIGDGSHVIRCPQHITEWTLRIANKRRTMETYKWAREAKEQDTYDQRTTFFEPLFLLDDF